MRHRSRPGIGTFGLSPALQSSSLVLAALATLMVTAGASSAFASEDEEQVATYAVQKRAFNLGHEFNAAVGSLPLDAFTKGMTLGGSYTYHFSDLWAWEVAHFSYVLGFDTDLKDELRQNFAVSPTKLESVQYFGSTNLVLKPLYGKFALFNRSVVHAELYLVLGGGVAKYTPSSFRPGPDFGGGIRLHASRHVSLRIDVRDHVFLMKTSPKNELYLAISVALSFGGDAR